MAGILALIHAKIGGVFVKGVIAANGWAVAAVGGYTIPAVTIGIALASLALAFYSQRRSARTDLTTMLYARIEDLERQLARAEDLLKEANAQIKSAREENIALMRELVVRTRKGELGD